eukprot:TRINITY_DN13946_c0_g4_i6.p1 TRINITY_DN13946_c0_g4~~TRINITY_DN13946_c0_g4_i6.p1  ORF type:complete len:143 (+),score=29.73 TRINITY_DN13946_c0_g4_i6:377-805(+)
MENSIGKTFLSKDGETDDTSIKNSKVVCLYFAAKWCPPCRAFTPILVDFYNDVNLDSRQLEIIYVSRDKSTDEFSSFFSDMPWLAIPFSDPRIESLTKSMEIKGIPTLLVLRKNGEIASRSARMDVQLEFTEAFNRWLELVK